MRSNRRLVRIASHAAIPTANLRERERDAVRACATTSTRSATEKETGFEPPPEPPAFVNSVRSITNVQSLRRLFHASPSAPARPGATPARAAEMFDERDEMVESSPSRRDDAAGVDDDVRESVLVEESAKESAIGGGEHRARARARGRLGARAGARGGAREIERVVGRDVRDEESPAPRVGDASAGRELDRHRRAGDESEVGEETRALEREANLATRRDEVRLAPLGMFQDVAPTAHTDARTPSGMPNSDAGDDSRPIPAVAPARGRTEPGDARGIVMASRGVEPPRDDDSSRTRRTSAVFFSGRSRDVGFANHPARSVREF